jgi:hypothetical protein
MSNTSVSIRSGDGCKEFENLGSRNEMYIKLPKSHITLPSTVCALNQRSASLEPSGHLIKLSMILNLIHPFALVYVIFALRRVYQQKWPMTLMKAVVLFACEMLLFVAMNIGGFVIAYQLV